MSDQESSDAKLSEDIEGTAAESAVPDDFVERIAAHDEGLAEVAATMRDRLATLEDELVDAQSQVDDLTSRLKRARADFENYKKRMERQREEVRTRATERLVERFVEIRTDLRRAIDTERQSIDDLIEGVKLTLRELDRVLDAEDVEEIHPSPGDEVDPRRHEVMVQVESEQPADTIAEVYEPGYEQADRVLKPAKVTVSDGPDEDEE